ncbi:microsomal dipeptidase-like Zn-dependent dipeptidase [Chitinivorax tropicus]|uniref:Microsomal dipeptidase-like Zn-dependent dipeptidase n=1 Tax=Chitinivorax tropicus TaxID=714531 RepID=A0A840MLR0_9PROT|nr:dipeptidase [Chitinivorax tropicus]MBB5020094.1 microsomal dipeptidase-like Zn-dependent dipeptidase [Chitinivorax tropicus]
MDKLLIGLLGVVLVGLGVFFFIAPALAERQMNPITRPPRPVSDKAKALHMQLQTADLHADSLLWGRDLLQRSQRGHVDIPRMQAGNHAFQVFTVVTKTPKHLNIERNDDQTDNIALLALAQRWPLATRHSLFERAMYQAGRLTEMASRSNGDLVLIKTRQDLEQFITRRKQGAKQVAGLLGIEGAHALDGDLNNLIKLYQAGFRLISPSHFFDTDIGGSAHGLQKGGLSEKGLQWLKQMEQLGMVVDLAHASANTINDVLRLATKPVVVSHTGVKGTCDNNRNLSDQQLAAIARNGGLVGIGFWDTAVCDDSVEGIAKAMRYTADRIGVQHVALGSDWDGAVGTPIDVERLPELTQALLDVGFSENDIQQIMGENVFRYLLQVLP